MTTQTEALKLALEALEVAKQHIWLGDKAGVEANIKAHQTIIFIKEALAQPEQREPTKQEHNILMGALKRSSKVVAQPEQEPVVTDAMVEAAVKAFWGYENSKVCRTAYRLAIKAALQEKFCDNNCVWTDHHPDCKLAQPDRQELQAKGKHPAPCARFCEANAFQIEIRNLKAKLENQHPECGITLKIHMDAMFSITRQKNVVICLVKSRPFTPPHHSASR